MKSTLPLRDLFLLPLLAILTVLTMYGASEILLRLTWADQPVDACLGRDGLHVAGCKVAMKTAEGPWVQFSFNACGFRSPTPCGPKPSGAVRLAVIGTSLAGGAYVDYPATFPARIAADLSQACARQVEVDDLGGFVHAENDIARQIGPALALQPAAVIIPMMPNDLERIALHANAAPPSAPPAFSLLWLKDLLADSRVMTVGQYYLFGNLQRFTDLYLSTDKAAFLRHPSTPCGRTASPASSTCSARSPRRRTRRACR